MPGAQPQRLQIKTPADVCRDLECWMVNKRVIAVYPTPTGFIMTLENGDTFRFEPKFTLDKPAIVAFRNGGIIGTAA